jgi:hypothetical protein
VIARVAPALLALTALLALPACGEREEAGADPPDPLIYEIASPDGEVEGWMLGTIHALPDGVSWRTPEIEDAIEDADLLLVEVAALDDQTAIAATFAQLATTEGLGPLAGRVDPALRTPLGEIIARSGTSPASFEDTEDWAAAIMLAQVDAYGQPRNGVDRALIREFGERPVVGFETAENQLGIFDSLAPNDQRDLLEGTVREWQDAQANPGKLTRAWLAGDLATIETATTEGIMADPELREALLVGRNRAWLRLLLNTLARQEKPLVAVGTAHLVGPDGLVEMLKSEGYSVRRLE